MVQLQYLIDANFVSYANGTQYSGDATSGYWVTRNLFSMNSGGTALGSNNSKAHININHGQLIVTVAMVVDYL